MNQIRYGQLAKYGEQRGNLGNLLGKHTEEILRDVLGFDPAKVSELLALPGLGGLARPAAE